MLFLFASCDKEKYPPVPSTEEEKRVVMTVELDNETYNVTYDLYRALFLNLKESVDGNDSSVWNGDNKDEYIVKIDSLIKERVAEIYSAFHICKKIGIDVYSKTFKKNIEKYIQASVEGGSVGTSAVEGFGGDYDAYLESLKKMNLNYSVQTLLIRYSLALSAIDDYYAGTIGNGQFVEDVTLGKLEYTKDDVRDFYDSDECVRVLRAFFPNKYQTRESVGNLRDEIARKSGEDAVGNYMISVSLADPDLKNGVLITRYAFDNLYFGEMIEAAFKLNVAETSEVIEIITGIDDGYYILYRAEKSDGHFNKCYDEIADVYVQHEIGKKLDTVSAQIKNALSETSFLINLDRNTISMETEK